METAGRAIPSLSLQLSLETVLPSLQETLPQLPYMSYSRRQRRVWGRVMTVKQSSSIIEHHSCLHTKEEDAVLSPCNTCHCSTEIFQFLTCNLYVPVAFPIPRNKASERTFCIQSLVLQTIPPSGFVPHFKVALGRSKMFAAFRMKENKVGSECK